MVKGLSLQILAEIAGTWLDDRKLLYNVFLNQVTQKQTYGFHFFVTEASIDELSF